MQNSNEEGEDKTQNENAVQNKRVGHRSRSIFSRFLNRLGCCQVPEEHDNMDYQLHFGEDMEPYQVANEVECLIRFEQQFKNFREQQQKNQPKAPSPRLKKLIKLRMFQLKNERETTPTENFVGCSSRKLKAVQQNIIDGFLVPDSEIGLPPNQLKTLRENIMEGYAIDEVGTFGTHKDRKENNGDDLKLNNEAGSSSHFKIKEILEESLNDENQNFYEIDLSRHVNTPDVLKGKESSNEELAKEHDNKTENPALLFVRENAHGYFEKSQTDDHEIKTILKVKTEDDMINKKERKNKQVRFLLVEDDSLKKKP